MGVTVTENERDRTVLLTGTRGRLVFLRGSRGMLAVVAEGRVTLDMCDPLLAMFQRSIDDDGRALSFIDAAEVTGADTALIERIADWVRARSAPMLTHTLIRSRLAQLSASMLQLLSRRTTLEVYVDRSKFMLVAQREWPGFVMPTFPT